MTVLSRREFVRTAGITTAGIMLGSNLKVWGNSPEYSTVAVAQCSNYDVKQLKPLFEKMFSGIGGLSRIVTGSAKVGLKLNITGGFSSSTDARNQGLSATETYWTHPAVVQVVSELLIDAGVSPSRLYFIEALWDWDTYTKPGFSDLQKQLGAQLIDLNKPDPYPDFAKVPVKNGYFYEHFFMNPIVNELDVLVSLAKMKEHSLAAITLSMKNLYGMVPMHLYQYKDKPGHRSAMHHQNGVPGEHVPRTVCDLNLARPVSLSVIDGIKTSKGGEATWCQQFVPHAYNTLVVGTDAVAADAVAAQIMGYNPMADTLLRPSGEIALNHLKLANMKALGNNNPQLINVKNIT